MRVYVDKTCKQCGEVFQHYHYKAYYCSNTCRQKQKNEWAKEWRANNLDVALEKERALRRKRAKNGKGPAYSRKRRSSKAGYADRFMERIRANTPDTDIDRPYLLELFGDTCALTGVPFNLDRTVGTSFTNPYAPSIDRIDSNLGYVRGNVQIVLSAVNFAKNAMSMDDFVQVWKDITKSWSALVD